MIPFAIAIHGGAGTILRARMNPELEATIRQGLLDALESGHQVLASGGSALDAVERAVVSLEDDPSFNAGRGAVFAHDGTHQFDAAIMRGDTMEAGAIAAVRGVRNPIALARRVMERSRYVMMVGKGAEDFAQQEQLAFADPSYFRSDLRFQQWQRVKDSDQTLLDHSDKGEKNFSTVGAVALDTNGHLAAATSTGGMTNKRFGRVGDSPIIGSGTYAENGTCAISATGHGEFFMRYVVAHDIAALMRYRSYSLQKAAEKVVMEKLKDLGSEGGLIAIDAQGNVAMPFNTAGMYRACRKGQESPYVGLFGDG